MSSIPRHMTGVLLTAHGGSEALMQSSEIPVPDIGHREVLVRVKAAGINNTDINTRIGWYSKGNNNTEDATWSGAPLTFPRIQGADVCGEIVAVGPQVPSERVGQRVIIEPVLREVDGEILDRAHYFGSECDGGFASLIGPIENGDIKPVVAAIYPLSKIDEAQQAFISKAHVGKLVLRIP